MIMSEKILEVKHLGKAFGSNQVLRDIDFSVSASMVGVLFILYFGQKNVLGTGWIT